MSMDQAEIVIDTFEKVAARAGDPHDLIYARLFERHPHFEDLFAMDTDGGIRANMLTTSLNCLLGVAEGSETPRLELEAARLHHEGYGLGSGDIDEMFEIIRDVFRDVLADDWTPAAETSWSAVLEKISRIGRDLDS